MSSPTGSPRAAISLPPIHLDKLGQAENELGGHQQTVWQLTGVDVGDVEAVLAQTEEKLHGEMQHLKDELTKNQDIEHELNELRLPPITVPAANPRQLGGNSSSLSVRTRFSGSPDPPSYYSYSPSPGYYSDGFEQLGRAKRRTISARHAPPVSAQPGSGPYFKQSIALHSVACQAAPTPWIRFYFSAAEGSEAAATNNFFFRHFDVCKTPPRTFDDSQPQHVLDVPPWMKKEWNRLYFISMPDRPSLQWPELVLHTSHDIQHSGQNICEERFMAARMEVEGASHNWPWAPPSPLTLPTPRPRVLGASITSEHSDFGTGRADLSSLSPFAHPPRPPPSPIAPVRRRFVHFVAQLQARTVIDNKPLTDLRCGIIEYLVDQLEGAGLKYKQRYMERETKMQLEFNKKYESMVKSFEEEIERLANASMDRENLLKRSAEAVARFRTAAYDGRSLTLKAASRELEMANEELGQEAQKLRKQAKASQVTLQTLRGGLMSSRTQNQRLTSELEKLKKEYAAMESSFDKRCQATQILLNEREEEILQLKPWAELGKKAELWFQELEEERKESARLRAAFQKRQEMVTELNKADLKEMQENMGKAKARAQEALVSAMAESDRRMQRANEDMENMSDEARAKWELEKLAAQEMKESMMMIQEQMQKTEEELENMAKRQAQVFAEKNSELNAALNRSRETMLIVRDSTDLTASQKDNLEGVLQELDGIRLQMQELEELIANNADPMEILAAKTKLAGMQAHMQRSALRLPSNALISETVAEINAGIEELGEMITAGAEETRDLMNTHSQYVVDQCDQAMRDAIMEESPKNEMTEALFHIQRSQIAEVMLEAVTEDIFNTEIEGTAENVEWYKQRVSELKKEVAALTASSESMSRKYEILEAQNLGALLRLGM
ncbi:hypothetical protein CYMTET_35207 [Cymbomonas tetramitiformis]|uniref:Uncharacterized protein n=1 Tax=Cymbomonas tetramitiformis TaxID=36881 RepID=A0AAE0KPE4_9CHLO|nr:hypothetical protein CYMTET_35207 [Cymbomonas tetramitiformis]